MPDARATAPALPARAVTCRRTNCHGRQRPLAGSIGPLAPTSRLGQEPRRALDGLAWSAAQLGRFIEATASEREAAWWRLLATTGMRRGELLGLRWADVDLDAGRLTIRQTVTMVGNSPAQGTPKSRAGLRMVALDAGTVAVLRAWLAQAAERLVMGAGWQGGDMLVTEADGSAVHPQVFTRRFGVLTRRAGLPTIRLHDVRHSYATAALGAGVPVKVLSQRIGHADVAVTLRVYAHVLPGDDEAAAALAATAITGV